MSCHIISCHISGCLQIADQNRMYYLINRISTIQGTVKNHGFFTYSCNILCYIAIYVWKALVSNYGYSYVVTNVTCMPHFFILFIYHHVTDLFFLRPQAQEYHLQLTQQTWTWNSNIYRVQFATPTNLGVQLQLQYCHVTLWIIK